MSYNKVDPTTGALTKIAGLVDDTDLKADIAEVQAVIPSDASSSNKLVDMSKFGAIEALTYSDADLKTFTENVCKTIKYAGSAEIPSSTNISCGFMNITQGTDQVTQMLFQFNEGKIWTRSRYGTWTSWQQITPTSTVTSGSTAPVTSQGVWDNCAIQYKNHVSSGGQVELTLPNGVYLIHTDEHYQDTGFVDYIVTIGSSTITKKIIAYGGAITSESMASNITMTRTSNGIKVDWRAYSTTYAWVSATRLGEFA